MRFVIAAAALAIGLVLAFGGYIAFLGVRNVVRASESRRWPATEGIVVGADTTRSVDTDRKTRIRHVTYSTKTVVQYRVGAQDYATNVIHFGQTLGSSDPSEAELQRLRYPPGAKVRVLYDPVRPWLAVLRPGIHADAFWLPAAGLAFLLPGVMAALMLPDWFRMTAGRDSFGHRDLAPAAVVAIMGFIFTALGVAGFGAGLARIWNGHASQRWPTTLGEVIFAKVTTSDSQEEDTGETNTTFSPSFVYRFEVDGAPHFNNLRRFGRVEGQGEDWARDIAARYPVGTHLQVAYLPTDPDIAVLEPGNDSEALWLPGVGLVALLFGLAAIIFIVPRVARD